MEIPSVRFLSDLPFFEVPKQVPRRRPLAKLQQHIKTLAPSSLHSFPTAFLNHEKSHEITKILLILDHLPCFEDIHVLQLGKFVFHCSRDPTSRSNIRAQHQVSTGIATTTCTPHRRAVPNLVWDDASCFTREWVLFAIKHYSLLYL